MRVEVRVEIGFLYRYEIELRDGGFGTKVGDQDRVSGRTSGSSFLKVVRYEVGLCIGFEKHSFVFTQPRPPTPVIDAPDREFAALERWDNSNLSAMFYIWASMSNMLKKQHEEHEIVRQIMDNLEEMFGEQIIQAKTDAIKGLMNYKQKVGTPIKEHMMKIMAYLSEAQANGAEIDAATQLVMVFQTLSKDFDLFQASYNLNRKEMSLTELMK
ncbi:hypothetical protein TIFTF001_047921 [Ficus carica]|uniref:Uncharacterized protein n=1 Tax=Ficus carica TaxID=3494 RepID=A0AA87Z556_FICCA|nr:hypothetical protein TIFTF001_047921 [Ficus carica]